MWIKTSKFALLQMCLSKQRKQLSCKRAWLCNNFESTSSQVVGSATYNDSSKYVFLHEKAVSNSNQCSHKPVEWKMVGDIEYVRCLVAAYC